MPTDTLAPAHGCSAATPDGPAARETMALRFTETVAQLYRDRPRVDAPTVMSQLRLNTVFPRATGPK